MTDTTKITELKERIMEEYRVKFNEVLGRMYNLEIIPDIQSRINKRIPEAGGFMVFSNDELADFLSQTIDETIRAVVDELRMEKLDTVPSVDIRHDLRYGYNQAINELNQKLDNLLSTIPKTGEATGKEEI